MGQDHLTKSVKNSTKVLKTTNRTTILISINPCHVKSIFNKSKKYEYRKRVAKGVKRLIIYETVPTKKVVGEAEVIETICLSPNELWAKTKTLSGISRSFFNSYFAGKSIAYAYRLGVIRKYNKPKTLQQMHINAAPQSYAFISSY